MNDTFNKREKLEVIVLLIVILFAVSIHDYWPSSTSPLLAPVLTLLSSNGLYVLFIRTGFWIVNRTRWGLRAYWGSLFLDGLWSYEYFRGGDRFFGVWEIRQDVNGTRVIGNGLDSSYRIRTTVRSVSPLIYDNGGYYILNVRNELDQSNSQVFSKTTLLIDAPSGFDPPVAMRGFTEVFGGPSDKSVHPNVIFRKHEGMKTIEELIEHLRKIGVTNDTSGQAPKIAPEGKTS